MEINHDLAIEEIYLPSKHDKDTYLCEDFIIYPEGKEKFGGYLMGIVELRATPVAESEKIIQTIINYLKEKYYNQINTSPDPQKLNLETVFEYALQETNEALIEMIRVGHTSFMLENLHYLIAVAKPNLASKEVDFFFTQQGLIQAYLLHKTKQNNFKVINIVENTPRVNNSETDRLKIFSSTLSGKIYYHDALYFCSEIFSNYIPAHKVNKIFSANDLKTVIDHFKNLINNVKNNSYLTYCSIFLKMEEKHLFPGQLISQKSIDNLISTKEKTEKYLTPTFALNLKDYFFKAISAFKRPERSNAPRELKMAHSSGTKSIGLLGQIIKSLFNIIFALPKFIWRLMTGKTKISEAFQNISEWPKSLAKKFMEKVFSLRRLNKTIVVVILVLIIGLVAGVYWINYRQQVKKEEAAYADEIKRAKDALNNAQVNLIYKNEAQSLEFVRQAEGIINYLPQATTNQKANFEELQRQSNTIKNKLLHIEQVTTQLVAEVLNNGQPANLNQLYKTGGNILISSRDNALFSLALDTKKVADPAFSEFGDLYRFLAEDDNAYFITNQNKLVKYSSTDKKFSPISISWGEGTEISSAQLYNNTIYAVDAKNQQIFKFKKNNDGFSGRESWLKDKGSADLSTASAITIDGNLFVATNTGQLYKFFTGKQQEFTLAPIEPTLTGVKKIFTSAGLDNIYILEPAGKRIVLVGKTGSFVAQYTFDSLPGEIKDFLIDNGTIYIISENKIFQATLK